MIICITGQMAAGKNFITSQYEKKGWLCLDADEQVHSAIKKAAPQILKEFEKQAATENITLKNPDGTLNRRNLGKLIFPHPELLKKQESIVYPIVIEETKKIIKENSGRNIILNATVLYKTPELLKMCDKIIFVKANFFVRLRRAIKRDRMPLRQILSRFWTQKNLFSEYKNTGIPLEIVDNN